MPDTCSMQLSANGESLMPNGLPAWLVVYGRMTGTCSQIRCRVRAGSGTAVLFSADASVDQNGVWQCQFPLLGITFSCDATIWVEAECIGGGQCSAAGPVVISCKQPATNGGNVPPGSGPGSGTGNGDWPWPWPASIFCPFIGRLFTSVLLLAWTAFLVAVAWQNAAAGAAAMAAVAADFGVLAAWTYFCQPHRCHVTGAMLWVAKRATIAGLGLLLMAPHLPMVIALWATGTIAGVLTGWQMQRRCPIPRMSTPLNQLPIW